MAEIRRIAERQTSDEDIRERIVNAREALEIERQFDEIVANIDKTYSKEKKVHQPLRLSGMAPISDIFAKTKTPSSTAAASRADKKPKVTMHER